MESKIGLLTKFGVVGFVGGHPVVYLNFSIFLACYLGERRGELINIAGLLCGIINHVHLNNYRSGYSGTKVLIPTRNLSLSPSKTALRRGTTKSKKLRVLTGNGICPV